MNMEHTASYFSILTPQLFLPSPLLEEVTFGQFNKYWAKFAHEISNMNPIPWESFGRQLTLFIIIDDLSIKIIYFLFSVLGSAAWQWSDLMAALVSSNVQWGQIHFEFPISNQNRSVFKKFITESSSRKWRIWIQTSIWNRLGIQKFIAESGKFTFFMCSSNSN